MKTITMPKDEYDELMRELAEADVFKQSRKVFSVDRISTPYPHFSTTEKVTMYNEHREAYAALEKIELKTAEVEIADVTAKYNNLIKEHFDLKVELKSMTAVEHIKAIFGGKWYA